MKILIRRFALFCILAISLVAVCLYFPPREQLPPPTWTSSTQIRHPVKWTDVPVRYPVSSYIALPSAAPSPIPRIQHEFGVETQHRKEQREKRQAVVKQAFLHSWEGYKKHAWGQDEVTPVSGSYKNDYGQRGATLIDSLDTLYIMGLEKEFNSALSAVRKIDFSTSMESTLNVFETTIRYLGGLLSAYDLSEKRHRILLDKAVQLGDMLYAAFDTPNRLPVTRWDWVNGALEGSQEASSESLSAELGSLSLEFTRLSQLTHNTKYYDAVQRITNHFENKQNTTHIPGLFPSVINAQQETFGSGRVFTLGGMSDSLYEYFPKEHLLLGGVVSQYRKLYERAIDAAKKHLFFRPLTPGNEDILISGTVQLNAADHFKFEPEAEHLTCFTGGMVAIGSKIFNRTEELDVARKLVEGCIWAYNSTPTGIMPETFGLIPCSNADDCAWSTEKWHNAVLKADDFARRTWDAKEIISADALPPGYSKITDKRFLLRPEAIESIFILYRITGDTTLQDAAWRMFKAIKNATTTEFANSAIADVTCPPGQEPPKLDSCESFWYGETLKYFYLVFSEPDLVSLDEYVLGTPAAQTAP